MAVEVVDHDGRTAVHPPDGARGGIRILVGLVGAAALNTGILLAGPAALVGVVYAPLLGIPMMLLMFGAVGFATAGILRLASGAWRPLSGVLGALAALAACIVLFMQAMEIPMVWIPALGIDVGFAPAGPIAAAAAAIALPRRWMRVLGGVLVLLSGTLLLVPSIGAAAERRAAEDEASRRLAAEQFENRLDGPRPIVTDWEGAHRVGDTSSYLTDGGAALQIDARDLPQTRQDEFACWILAPAARSYDETLTMDDFAGICAPRGDGRWERVDGSAIALVLDGRLVTVGPPDVGTLADLGVDRVADPEEIAAAAARMRPLTREEFRAELLREQERAAQLDEPAL
jgi:hypothetical protein